MNIFTIVVIYNGMQRNWIQKCFDSLLLSSIATEIIAIDNGSTDGSVEFVKRNYPQIKLIVANENLGFAKANNIGIKYALEHEADYVFLLNQDAWIEKETIEKLVEAFKQLPKAGIVAPIHLNGDKTNFDRDYIAHHFAADLYFNRLQNFYETQFVCASAWLISKKCIETIGGFDTLVFYHYGEDDNYLQRAIYHNFKIYIVTTTTICHDRGERNGNYSAEHEKRESEVVKSIYYADIRKNDKVLDEFKKMSLRYAVKKILKLQFKNLFTQRKLDRYFYMKIEQSREQNKKKGLNWLV